MARGSEPREIERTSAAKEPAAGALEVAAADSCSLALDVRIKWLWRPPG